MLRGSEFAELTAFAAVARERSFRRAAASLGMSPSALSHAVRSAEERMGTRLFNRTTRSVALTEAGAAFLERVAPALAELDAAVAALKSEEDRPRGTLRLSMPRLAATLVIAPVLTRFTRDFSDIQLDLIVDDKLVDIVADGFDAGIRLRDSVPRDMVAVPVTPPLRGVYVASPDYLRGRPAPETPDDLRAHRCVVLRMPGSGAVLSWDFERRGRSITLKPGGALIVNDHDLLVAAALGGVGVACVTEPAVQEHIEGGRLVRLLDEWSQPFDGFHLYYPHHRIAVPALAALVGAVRHGSAGLGCEPIKVA